jgi:hypothetical protein
MSTEYLIYLGSKDGVSHHMRNMVFIAWVIYSPKGQLVSLGNIHSDPSMNNVDEYIIIIDLLCETISHGVQSLEVHLDSQLVVSL